MPQDGVPRGVKLIILPADDACALDPDRRLEEALVSFVRRGGVLVHGPLSGTPPRILRQENLRTGPS